ncbi:MFS transporter [Microbacterium keratanolyticum]|uniref:MFS transporter n=1 Tax=Microbacterium keratanolyticum TaxID=67574 RepID=UPI00363B43CC
MTILTDAQLAAAQKRIVAVLSFGQILGGIAFGATVSLGALLAADLSGDDALSGLATASVTLGAAAAAIPLGRAAGRWGRRFSLTAGNLFALFGVMVVIGAASLRSFPLLLVGIIMIGAGNAGNLQSRFAATDLASPKHRGRDLSVVVWSTTIGAVAAPLMLTPGEQLGALIGMPPLTGSYLFSFVAQAAALTLYLVALRPDPLLTAQARARDAGSGPALDAGIDRPWVARYAMFAVAGSHVVMASVMAMTPIHLSHMVHAQHGASTSTTDVTALVGVTIALHVGGMYALSPLFGILADRWGRVRTILLGQALLAASLLFAIFVSGEAWGVIVALTLLGLGWSAATVAGATLLTEVTPVGARARRQGLSDSIMSLSAATAAALAGVVLSGFGYAGLAIAESVFVIAIVALTPFAVRRIRASRSA